MIEIVKKVLSPELRVRSIAIFTLWLAVSFAYYGIVLLTTELAVVNHSSDVHQCGRGSVFQSKDFGGLCSKQCGIVSEVMQY